MKQFLINTACYGAISFTILFCENKYITLAVCVVAAIVLGCANFSDGMNRAEHIYRPERFR